MKQATRLEPVYLTSSNLDCIGWLADKLFIRFKTGESYSYDDCPRDYFHALQSVESSGKFFCRFVRGKFSYTKLPSDPFAPANPRNQVIKPPANPATNNKGTTC